MVIAAITLGIICLLAWYYLPPIVGIPFGIASVIVGRKAHKEKRRASRTGLTIGWIALIISTADTVIGFVNKLFFA